MRTTIFTSRRSRGRWLLVQIGMGVALALATGVLTEIVGLAAR